MRLSSWHVQSGSLHRFPKLLLCSTLQRAELPGTWCPEGHVAKTHSRSDTLLHLRCHAQNPEEVREMILRTHDQYDNRNQLVSYAFSLEHKVGERVGMHGGVQRLTRRSSR